MMYEYRKYKDLKKIDPKRLNPRERFDLDMQIQDLQNDVLAGVIFFGIGGLIAVFAVAMLIAEHSRW